MVNQILGNWNTGSAWNAGFWSELPKRIREAYIFIENVHPNEAQKMTAEYVENMKNEARFLIAYYYWILVNAYGAVPMYTEALPSDAPMEELMIGQQTFDYMINWIDGQLVDLSKKLPAYYDDPNMYGRATSIMCLAVRSRMLLFAASPLVNGNADYIGHKNTQGEEIFNPTYDPNKWQKAADASRELIEAAHEAGHELYKEYKNGEIDPFLSYRNMMFTTYYNGNKEILFARPECNFNEYDGHAIPHGSGGNGGLGVTQSLVDAFFMENGLPAVLGYNQDYSPIINEESGYSESGFHGLLICVLIQIGMSPKEWESLLREVRIICIAIANPVSMLLYYGMVHITDRVDVMLTFILVEKMVDRHGMHLRTVIWFVKSTSRR